MTLAITIDQPYASLIAHGIKTIETRPAPPFPVPGVRKLPGHTLSRGDRVLIHASKRKPKHGMTVGTLHVDTYLSVDETWERTLSERSTGRWGFMDLPLGAIVASAVLRDAVPIVGWREAANVVGREVNTGAGWINPVDAFDADRDRYRSIMDAPRLAVPDNRPAELQGIAGDGVYSIVSDQLPLGDFTPGRWAWLLDDVKPTTERCPACWTKHHPMLRGWMVTDCPHCGGCGRCEPIQAKGKQGVWRWEP